VPTDVNVERHGAHALGFASPCRRGAAEPTHF
jgi:hypothetical protein